MNKVLAIPDLHAPFTDLDALSFVYSLAEEEQPDIIIQLGDALDMFGMSKHPHDFNLMTPKQEIEEGCQILNAMWSNLQICCPKARMIQLAGNHLARLPKRIEEQLPQIVGLFKWEDMFKFKNVETYFRETDYIEIDNVLYIHGHLSRPSAHMAYYNQSVVRGHSHRASITYKRCKNGVFFEMECGMLADEKKAPLQYGKASRTQWINGVGIVDDNGPRFVLI